MAEEGERTPRRRVRPVLLVLLWVWAILVFVVVDLFRNVPAFDRIRPEAKLYEGMRKAAHEMVGEPYRGPLGDPRAPARAVATARNGTVGYDDPERARREPAGERSVYRDLRRVGVQRSAAGGYTKWNDPGNGPGRGAMRDGQRDGLWTWDWPDGGKRETREYRRGVLQGTVTAWYRNGTKQVEERYGNGVPEGAWNWWFPDGRSAIEAIYANGRLHGRITKWYENGQVALRGELREGEREGDWTEYDEAGNETRRAVYMAGRQVG
jgi:antitoxin component YwqK of YwqJK toxin-antitoxin module